MTDTFTDVLHDEIDAFHHPNEQNTDIKFTKEVEENGKLSRDNNSLWTTVYRKPTHRQITRRVILQPDITQSHNYQDSYATSATNLQYDRQLIRQEQVPWPCFSKKNYNEDFIQRNTHRPTTTTQANNTATPTTIATLPYIKGISENISRILKPFNICVAHKPITTLRQLLINVKDKDEPRNRQGAVYKINCSDCHASYIDETGGNLTTRLTEHKRASRKGDVNDHIAELRRLKNHTIDWDSA